MKPQSFSLCYRPETDDDKYVSVYGLLAIIREAQTVFQTLCYGAYTSIINPEIFEEIENSERVDALPYS
jgi:hypothetical protein